jgi:TPR repeat protein
MSRTLKILSSIALLSLTLTAAAAEPTRQQKPAYLSADQDNFLSNLEIAAQAGDTDAQMFLGMLYFKGGDSSLPKNPEIGKAWFMKAIDNGNVCAMVMLGYLYKEGLIVNRDYDEAAHWLRLAADNGGQEAQWELLKMYSESLITPQDDDEVRRLIIQTAENGFIDSRAKAADIYLGGLGNPQDLVEAYKWISLAIGSAPDDVELSKKRDEIAGLMTDQQLMVAKNKVPLWKSKHQNECEALARAFR